MTAGIGRRGFTATVLSALLLIATAAAVPSGALGSSKPGAKPIPQSSCFWTDQVASKFSTDPAKNYAFPDTGAVYWSSNLAIPPGATVVLKGKYAHARYQSINSYRSSDNTPIDAVNDVSTEPDAGSRNPYVIGARRDTGGAVRHYTLKVVNEPPPATGAPGPPNTLFAGVAGQDRQQLLYRVYLPDHYSAKEATGGVGLPKANLRLADGTVLKGQAACDALAIQPGPLNVLKLGSAAYNAIRHPGGESPTFPATNPTNWDAFYSIPYVLQCSYEGNCGGTPARTGGQYSNIDNQYTYAFGNRGFADGPVWVLHGKLPTTPQTGPKVKRMPAGDLRYWSICQNESIFTTRGAGCLYDKQVPTDKDGMYTIVTSTAADRPDNAHRKCGVGFIPWPAAGDGAGNTDDSFLILRNMLPSPQFDHAVQDTQVPGDEEQVMGDYLPTGSYETTAQFEKRGC